jgi:Tfp pilus assembly protein PilO
MSLSLNAMSLKLKIVLLLVLTVVVAAGWYLISYRPGQKDLAQLRTQVVAKQQEVANLDSQLKHLQALKANEPKLRAVLARYDRALPADPKLPEFILQMHDIANKAGVAWISVAPSVPSAPTGAGATNAATGLREISVSINTSGKYFALQNFMYRLERLNRVLRVDNFGISPVQAGSLSVSMKMRMFMRPAAPAATTTTPTTPKAGA